jgi:hypothetical protein
VRTTYQGAHFESVAASISSRAARVLVPAGVRPQVHLRELPHLAGVVDAALQAAGLLGGLTVEPVLEQHDSGVDDGPFDLGDRGEERLGLLLGAEPHDPLDAGPVVPAAVEHDDLAGGGQVGM